MATLTKEQLEALPERMDYVNRMLEQDGAEGKRGDMIRERVAPKFCAHRMQPDDVILFRDSNGESWFVDYHLEGGPYKRRACL